MPLPASENKAVRQGAAEVIYGAGKTPEQIIGIAKVMTDNGFGAGYLASMINHIGKKE